MSGATGGLNLIFVHGRSPLREVRGGYDHKFRPRSSRAVGVNAPSAANIHGTGGARDFSGDATSPGAALVCTGTVNRSEPALPSSRCWLAGKREVRYTLMNRRREHGWLSPLSADFVAKVFLG
jgi:hypothetical protein